jgi:hypothetical protein
MRVTPRRAATAAAAGCRQRHLGRRVELERRAHRARDRGHRGVLHDQRVDPRRGGGPHHPLDGGQLGLEDERVQGQVAAGAGGVDLRHHRRQIGQREVVGPGSRVPALVDAEVDRVGAGGQRRSQGRRAAGRRQDLAAAIRHRGRSTRA